MSADRTEANTEAVISFLKHGLGGEIKSQEAGTLAGIYFYQPEKRGRLQIGEMLLADADKVDLLDRLRTDEVVVHLRKGQSVRVMSDTTEIDP